MQSTIPKEIRENIARARGYLHRNELTRALEAMSSALRQSAGAQLLRQARFEMEVHFEELLRELERNPGMQPLLDPNNTGKPRSIPYQRNKETLLATVLESLGKMLTEAAAAKEREALEGNEQRKLELIETGVARLKEGDSARGRAFLKRAAAEFGHKPGVYLEVGQKFLECEEYMEAYDLFDKAIESAPKEVIAYTLAVEAAMKAYEYPKAEAIYLKILRQFGGHPRTYGRMAQMYMAWHKRAAAEDFAMRALQVDPAQPEAKAVIDKIHRRI